MISLYYPLEQIYKYLYLEVYSLTGNYGIALILLSLFIYIVLFPFNQKAQQIQNLEREVQSIIAPQIIEIKKKYHGKEQYEKIQRLYHRYAYHPIYAIRSAAGIVLQIPFFVAARSMLYALPDIKGVQWGIIQDLGKPDQLLWGINILPFVMTLVTVLYAFVMPKLTRKEITQTIIIGIIFLVILYPAPSALLIFWTWNLLWSLLHCVIFDRFQWANDFVTNINDYISDNELAIQIFFALALTAGLLVPLEVYIKNASQLWFGIKDAVKFFLSDTAIYFAILFIIYILFYHKHFRCFYLPLLLGFLVGVFLQSYVVSIDYGMFDGHEIRWEEYIWHGIVNTFIWLVCLGGAFVFFRRLKFDKERILKFVKPLTFCIVSIQCVVLALNVIKNPLPPKVFQRRDSINVLTTKDMFTISSRDNIIVFLLDAFDAKIFEEIMLKNPELIEELKDFTFYPDTTSVYGYSDFSMPQILTGKLYYNDRPYTDYIEEAWHDNPFYQKLVQNNYDISIYAENSIVSKAAPISNMINEKIVLSNKSIRGFSNIVLFRMMPHYIKRVFYEYDPNAWIDLLVNQNIEVYREDDRKFYINLKKGLSYFDNKNCFRFYHLMGAHYPFILDRDLNLLPLEVKGTQYEQSLGVIKIVSEYIRQMRQKGVFANSTFVIMADHGDHNKIGSRPLLCIKQPNDSSEAISISGTSVSFSSFIDILFRRFQDRNYDKDLITSKVRKFYFLDRSRNVFIEYLITGNAKKIESWKRNVILENYHNKQNHLYILGQEISFTLASNDSDKYKIQGWYTPEEFGTWTLGAGGGLSFKINDYSKQNLKCSIVGLPYLANLPNRNMEIFVNNKLISRLEVNNKSLNTISFKIPSSVIENSKIDIRFVIDHPDIAVKYEARDLGLFVQRMKIEVDK